MKKYLIIIFLLFSANTFSQDIKTDTCAKRIDMICDEYNIILNAKESEKLFWKQAYEKESKYSNTYRKELFGMCVVAFVISLFAIK